MFVCLREQTGLCGLLSTAFLNWIIGEAHPVLEFVARLRPAFATNAAGL